MCKTEVGKDPKRFPLGRVGPRKKMHLINWKTVCLSRDKGGLGICGVLNLNKALLGKWNWRFVVEDNALWREFIKIKYGTEEGGWVTQVPRGSYGVGL